MQFILGSRSPRRRELLEAVVGADQLLIRAPANSDEQGFDGLRDAAAIAGRLSDIVRIKMADVVAQFGDEAPKESGSSACFITADTIVVAEDPRVGTVVLGQPREQDWQPEVRDWMLRLYSGASHEVWTGFQLVRGQQSQAQIVKSTVRFASLSAAQVDRYLATAESVGKAGGYAIQGAAAAFVNGIDGSLTNIIGLPVMELIQVAEAMGIAMDSVSD